MDGSAAACRDDRSGAGAAHVLLGWPITAREALDYGLVTAVAADEADLERQVGAWRRKLCANAPLSIASLEGDVCRAAP
jgi:enoyl-CoA hydratase/carnithine racemase